MKKLIALAVASAFIAPAAFADSSNVTIGGNLNTAVLIGQDAAGNSYTKMSQNNDSELNFSGTEDLGNGTTAYWRVGNAVNVDGDGPTGFANRDTYVGLKGSWGDLRLGRGGNDAWPIVWGHPFRYVDLSQPHYTAMDWSLVGGVGAAYNYASSEGNNQITYLSPDMNGFSFGVSVGSIEHNNKATNTAGDLKGHHASTVLSAKYNAGSWNISAGYQDHNADGDANTPGEWPNVSARIFMLGGGFNVGSVSVGLQAARTRFKNDPISFTNFGFVLSGSLSDKMSWMLKGTTAKKGTDKRNVISAGLSYSLGKRTDVGIEFASGKTTGAKTETQLAIGLNQSF